jgi:hypothetical protein
MAAYGDFADVLSRAGRIGGAFQLAGSKPNQTDVEEFLTDTAAELDSAIRSRGFSIASLSSEVKAALKDVNVYGALSRALAGLPDSPEVTRLRDYATAIWEGALAAIAAGTFPALAELEVGPGGEGGQAGSFWGEEEGYPTEGDIAAMREWPSGAPGFAKGMSL